MIVVISFVVVDMSAHDDAGLWTCDVCFLVSQCPSSTQIYYLKNGFALTIEHAAILR